MCVMIGVKWKIMKGEERGEVGFMGKTVGEESEY